MWKKDASAGGGYSPFATTTDTNGKTSYRAVRKFTQDEVRTGTGEAGGEGLITNNLMLKVNTTDIPDTELSNYKLEMSVIAYDSQDTVQPDGTVISAAPTGKEAVLKDYFIFTIAELKTDME